MSTISSQNPTTVVTIATPGPRGPVGPPSPAGDISGSLELEGSLTVSGSFVDFSDATYVTGSFTGSYTGSFVGDGSGITGPNLSPYAVLTGSNQFSGSNHFTGSLIPEASGSGGGIYDLGSASKPWKDLYLSTSSLNFVKEGNIISSINGEEKGIRIGNIFIGTGSISVVSGSGDNMSIVTNVIGAVIGESGSVDKILEQYITSSGAAILTGSLLVSGSGVSGSFSGSFEGDGNGLTNINPSVLPSGTVSSSAQTIANLPLGTISSSEQLPSDIVSGSTQITDLGFINNTITSSMSVLNAETSSIANSLKTGLNLVVNQITGSTASFISMSVGYLESITGSAKIVGDAFIILNNDTPVSRYAGLKVIDSGSVNTTSSFLYDGLNNNWFYEKEESGTTKHGITLFGPEYTTTGTPTYLTPGTLPKAEGNHNLVDSNIIDNGSEVKISTATTISGSVIISGSTVRILADNSYNAVHITGGLDISRDLAVKDDLTVYDDTNLRKDVNIGYRGNNPDLGYSLTVTQSTNESGSAKFEGTVLVEGKVSASLFEGDGSLLTNVSIDPSTLPSGTVSSSAQTIANLPSGVVSGSEQLPSGLVSSSAQTIANLPSGTISSSTQLPSGIVSGSTQISDLGFVTSDITSSTIITSSANLNTITFTKGDNSTFTITLDTGSDAPLPSGVISSSAQVKDSLPSGVISGSEQLPSGIISSSTQLPSGIVSSSTQTISNLPSGTVSGSSQVLFSGISGIPSGIISGSEQLPSGLVSSSTQTIANLPSGTVSSSAQTIENLPTGTISSSNQLPSGIISGSEQLPLGIVSSSAQTIANLPSGTISGSEQLPSGIISGSEQLPSGIVSSSAQTIANLVDSTILSGSISTLLPSGVVSSSAQTIANLPSGTISSSEQLPSGIISGSEQLPSGLLSSSAQVKDSLPSGVISGSEQLPSGIISSSVQIIDNLPSGTVSGSEQVLFSGISGVPSGIVSSSAQTISNLPSGVISGSEQLPSGLVSSSTQTIANLPSGTVSSSAQTIDNLPIGTISSSEQLPSGIISGSTQLPLGIVSSSAQTIDNLPTGTISSSEQLPAGIISGSEQLPAGIISSSTQLPSGIISGSEQLPSGLVSSSTQTIANLPSGTVSGSIQIDLASTTGTASWATNSTHTDAISINSFQSDTNFKNIPIARTTGTDGTLSIDSNIQWRGNPDTLRIVGNIEATSFTGSLSYNDLDEVPSGIISGSTQLPSGIVSSSSQTIANLPSGTISSSTQLPSGIISGSEQLPSGIVSSSSQTIANLPSGTISSSTQLPAGIVSSSTQTIENLPSGVISGSEQLPSGLVSSSTQTIANLPIGVISGSTQIGDLGFINSTVTSSMSVLNAETASIANSLKTGLDLVVNQITGSTASFISMSVGYLESITGSAKIIGDSFIILNNDTPTNRFAGLKVIDSGSVNTTSSFEYDGLNNNWFYEREVAGTANFGVSLFGPEYSIKGTPTYLTTNTIPKSQGNHNLVDSNLIDNGSEVKISTNTIITGSLLVSGSGISGSFSGSFEGNGSGLTNIDPSVLPSGVVSSSAQTIANLPSGTISSSTQLPSGIISGSTQLPSGIVSSSAQTIANFPSGVISGSEQLPSGIVSSSAQTIANLPSGTISSSTQLPSGIISGSEQLPLGLVSSSTQTIANLPSGVVSGSTQISDLGFVNNTITSSMSVLNAETASIANSLKTGLDLVVNQITALNNISSSGDLIGNSILVDDYIKHAGDTNSYVGFSGLDNFVIFTNGTRKMRVRTDSIALEFAGSEKLITTNTGIDITGNITATNFIGTASYVENAQTASYVTLAQTASYVAGANVDGTVANATSASYAQTSSYAVNFNVSQSLTASGLIYPTADGDDGRVIVTDGAGNLSLGDGERLVIQVRNDEGSNLDIGDPIYSRGEIGASTRILIGKADASDSAKMPVIGILQQDLDTSGNQDGFAVVTGILNENISGFTGLTEGDTVYVSGGGGLTITKPTGSDLIQNVGIILKTNGTTIQGLKVSAIGRSNDVPNIQEGYVWVGDSNGVATPAATSSIQNVVSSSYTLTAQTASYVEYNNLDGIPSGIISSSTQLPSGIVSSSAQTIANLPSGIVSGSEQLPAGIISSSNQVDITLTTGYTAFSSSLTTTDQTISASVATLSGSASTARDVLNGSLAADIQTNTNNIIASFTSLTNSLNTKAGISFVNSQIGILENADTTISASVATLSGSASAARQEIIDGTVALNNIEITGSLSVKGNVEIDGGLFTTVITPSLQNTGFPFYNLDCSEGNFFEVTLPSNQTGIRPTPINASPGQTINFKVTQNSTTASTLEWVSTFNFADGFDSSVSTGLGDIDVFSLITYDGSNWFVTGLKNFS